MPWTPKEFRERHNKSLSDKEARRAAAIANAVLKKTGDDGKAVRTANAAVKRGPGLEDAMPRRR
jgi:uncharacterized protein YdaT